MRSAKLSNATWAWIEPLMPQADERSRPWRDHRQWLRGWFSAIAPQWRDLPEAVWPVAVSIDFSIVGAHQYSATGKRVVRDDRERLERNVMHRSRSA
jgi:hypothetical protein